MGKRKKKGDQAGLIKGESYLIIWLIEKEKEKIYVSNKGSEAVDVPVGVWESLSAHAMTIRDSENSKIRIKQPA